MVIKQTFRVLALKSAVRGGDGQIHEYEFETEEAATDSQRRLKTAGFATSKQAPGTWGKR